mgnify:CR=1 FL=1
MVSNQIEVSSIDSERTIWVLMTAIVFISMGQSVYWQTIPILGREFGFSEIQITSIISSSSFIFLVLTPWWGKLSDQIGRKKVLLIGLIGYVLTTLLFSFIVYQGLMKEISFLILFSLILFVRILNSSLVAGQRPAMGAYVADITSEEDRSAGMGKFGAANNLGTILGPVLVGTFVGINLFSDVVPSLSLLTPILFMTVLTICILLVVILFLPESKIVKLNVDSNQNFSDVLDSNLKLLLLIGTLVFIAFAIIQSVTAFYLQDKFNLDYYQTASATAISLGSMAISSIIVQLTFIQRFSGPSIKLLEFSLSFFALGSLIIIFANNFIIIVCGMAFIGVGMGLASPGYTATASLNSNTSNQGAAVGLAMVAPGLGFTIGPISGGFLYETNHIFPFVIILPILLVIYLLLSRLKLKK